MKRAIFLFLLAPLSLLAQDFKPYNNYDFVPGDTILFEDHFTDEQTGERTFTLETYPGTGRDQ